MDEFIKAWPIIDIFDESKKEYAQYFLENKDIIIKYTKTWLELRDLLNQGKKSDDKLVQKLENKLAIFEEDLPDSLKLGYPPYPSDVVWVTDEYMECMALQKVKYTNLRRAIAWLKNKEN